MPDFIDTAVFVYDGEGETFRDMVENNTHGVHVSSQPINAFLLEVERTTTPATHVIVAAELSVIKTVLHLGHKNNFSVGFLPLPGQKRLFRNYGIPENNSEALSLALHASPRPIDLVFCNEHILLFSGSAGRIPLVDSPIKTSKMDIFIQSVKRLFSLNLLSLTITTSGKSKSTISTAACGFMLFEQSHKSFATRLIGHDFSFADKTLSMVIVAPISILAYLSLIL